MSASVFELPPGGRVRAVGTIGPEGLLVAVGIAPQPWRPRAVVEATVETVGSRGAIHVLGQPVQVSPDAQVSGPDGVSIPRDAIAAGARVWLGGRWSETSGFVADEVRLRPRLEFEIVKVAGPARDYDARSGRVEIAGFTVVMNDRTLLGADADGEDGE